MGRHPLLVVALLALGAAWVLTQPLGKIAVTAGFRPLGILFWQLLIGAVLLGLVARSGRRPLPRTPRQWALAAVVAVLGTLLPQAASYEAIGHLPSGIVSMITALVPILAFPWPLPPGWSAPRPGVLRDLSLVFRGRRSSPCRAPILR